MVQGPGGNISYKNKETMIIKASGKKMSDARKRNIFVETDHKKIISAIENALDEYNIRIKEAPITPIRILELIEASKTKRL